MAFNIGSYIYDVFNFDRFPERTIKRNLPYGIFLNNDTGDIHELGRIRHDISRKMNLKHNFNNEKTNTLEADIEGCAGELAVCKYLNVEWERDVNTFKDFDVLNIQVRCMSYINGMLIFRIKDNPDHFFELVYYNAERNYYKILGGAFGKTIKKYGIYTNFGKKNEPYCWALSQKFLYPPYQLFDYVNFNFRKHQPKFKNTITDNISLDEYVKMVGV